MAPGGVSGALLRAGRTGNPSGPAVLIFGGVAIGRPFFLPPELVGLNVLPANRLCFVLPFSREFFEEGIAEDFALKRALAIHEASGYQIHESRIIVDKISPEAQFRDNVRVAVESSYSIYARPSSL
jgi:hypothetical protein